MREASLLAEVSIVFREGLREGGTFPSLFAPTGAHANNPLKP